MYMRHTFLHSLWTHYHFWWILVFSILVSVCLFFCGIKIFWYQFLFMWKSLFFYQILKEWTNLAFLSLLTCYDPITRKLVNDDFCFWWDLKLCETICFTKNDFLMTISFSTANGLWKTSAATSPFCKQIPVLKEWSPMLLVLMMFNNGCLLFIINKVCLGDVIQN